jgi:hypothetical protein
MPIDRSGALWRGSEAADLDAYLASFQAGGYPVGRTAHSRCATCGGTTFALRVDDEAGYADRRCLACNAFMLMLDSDDSAEDAAPEECACPCGGEAFELAVGYAVVEVEDESGNVVDEVKWVSVGARCVRDGALGVYADW